MPGTTEVIQFGFFSFFFSLCVLWQKNCVYKNIQFFKKFYLTTNIVMLVNLEPNLGFRLEIKSIPNYLHGHTVSAICFNMGNILE